MDRERIGLIAEEVHGCWFSPDSKTLWLGDDPANPTVNSVWPIFQLPSFERRTQTLLPGAKIIFILPGGNDVAFATPQEMGLWDLDQQKATWKFPQTSVYKFAYCPRGNLIAASTTDRRVIVVDAANGKLVFESANLSSLVQNMTFSGDGRTLVTAAVDGTIKFIHVATGQGLLEFSNVGLVQAMYLEFTDSRHLVFGVHSKDAGKTNIRLEIVIFDASDPVAE